MLKAKINNDPDDFFLSKSQIIDIVNNVIKYMAKDPLRNSRMITSMTFFKIGLMSQNEEDVKNMWRLIFKFTDSLRFKSALFDGNMPELLRDLQKGFLESPTSIAEEIFHGLRK